MGCQPPGRAVDGESPASRGTKDYHWRWPVAPPYGTQVPTPCATPASPWVGRGRGHPNPWEDGGRWRQGRGGPRNFQKADFGLVVRSKGISTTREFTLPLPAGQTH